ncbi:MAG: hypothetical protein KGL39_21105 [Patescibacteria group bacterium]|nr:hypothetical protein [Patescibacteria group bacterium]
MAERKETAPTVAAEQKEPPVPLATQRIAATLVLRYFAAPPFPSDLVGSVYDYVGRSCVWTLQQLATKDRPARRRAEAKDEKRVHWDVIRSYLPQYPNQLFGHMKNPPLRHEYVPIADNFDKVVAYCARTGMAAAIRFLTRAGGNDIHNDAGGRCPPRAATGDKVSPIVVLAGAARGGHVAIIREWFPKVGTNEIAVMANIVSRQAALGSCLDRVIEFVDALPERIKGASASCLSAAFNTPNTTAARLWLLKQHVKHNTAIDKDSTAIRVKKLDLHPSQLSRILRELPTRNEKYDMVVTIADIAFQAGNRELIAFALMREPDARESCAGLPPMLLDEMLERVEYKNALTTETKEWERFINNFEHGHAKREDLKPEWAADNNGLLESCVENSVRFGKSICARRCIDQVVDQSAARKKLLETAAKYNRPRILRAALRQMKRHGEAKEDAKAMKAAATEAAQRGHTAIAAVLCRERQTVPTDRTIFKLSPEDKAANALSDTRDRAGAMIQLIRATDWERLLLSISVPEPKTAALMQFRRLMGRQVALTVIAAAMNTSIDQPNQHTPTILKNLSQVGRILDYTTDELRAAVNREAYNAFLAASPD